MRNLFVHLLSVSALIFSSLFSFSQDKTDCDYVLPGQTFNWTFGEKALLQFSEDGLVSSSMPGSIDIPKGVSAISDEAGNLVFFTDGIRVYTSGFFFMNDATDLQGNPLANQSSLFVPSSGNPNKYFLFTADLYVPPVYTNGIRFSVLERLSTGWTITEKNTLLLSQNTQKLAGVRHANGVDYWVVTHGFGSDKGGSYYAFLVTSDSIVMQPVESVVGERHEGDFNNNGGYMKISPDGSRIALAVPEAGLIEMADFDSETGRVSNPIHNTSVSYPYALGVEFSGDSKMLYLTTNPLDASPNKLYQFDLEQNGLSNPTELASYAPVDGKQLGALQLASDGRIYVANFGASLASISELGVIYNPERAGVACNFNTLDGAPNNGVALTGSGSKEGLPNFVSSLLDLPYFWWTNHCHTHITTFRFQNEANNGQVNWSFNDGAASDSQLRGQHTFSEPGVYNVIVSEEVDGVTYSHTRQIEIFALPPVEIGNGADTIYILPNSSITLDAGEYDTYVWEPDMSDGRYLDVDQEGLYAVTVTDSNCCSNRDEVFVKYANLFLPNAFRPGSTITQNSVFKALGPVFALNNFRLLIYNRWGQQVFETTDALEGWDGTYSGEQVQAGTYVWMVSYESRASRFQEAQKVVQRGIVNLIR